MHVIVARAVLDEESAADVFETVCVDDGCGVVAGGVGGEGFHVAFCVPVLLLVPGKGEGGEGRGRTYMLS